MEQPYLIEAPLHITFELVNDENRERFMKEFKSLSEAESDPIGHWLKIKKAKGETQDSDEVLIELIVELHRKVERLEKMLKGENIDLKPLEKEGEIESINFTHFKFRELSLEPQELYYGRVELKLYPQREIPIFFKATSETLAEIDKIHDRDEKDWGTYFRARERVMIRERRK